LKKKYIYNYIIIFRPDYIVWEKINVPINIDENTFYLNKHGPDIKSGESIFIIHQSKLKYFNDLLNDVENGNIIPESHNFYYKYFCKIKKMKCQLLNYDVGNNCEQVTILYRYYHNNINLKEYLKRNVILITIK
jgi:hypothetical protein